MVGSLVDWRLLGVLEGTRIDTISDVIACMAQMDEILPPEDGLKWFNRLYLMVTEEIERDLSAERWADGAWLERLDVLFARLYFDAIVVWLRDPARAPSAWASLLERRTRPGIAGVQYGMAGLNAHINRDLPVAVVQTCEEAGIRPERRSAQHADYDRINGILETIEIRAMRELATGFLGAIARRLGTMHDKAVMWPVRTARAAAWINAEALWRLRDEPTRARLFVDGLDRLAGFAGRRLLFPTEPFATQQRALVPRRIPTGPMAVRQSPAAPIAAA